MTHSYVWHDSFICVTWLIHMCDMTHSYVWHDSFICVTWLIHDYILCATSDTLSHQFETHCNTLQHSSTHCNTNNITAHTTGHVCHTYMKMGPLKLQGPCMSHIHGSCKGHVCVVSNCSLHKTNPFTMYVWHTWPLQLPCMCDVHGPCNFKGPISTLCNTLQHTVTHCNTLQHKYMAFELCSVSFMNGGSHLAFFSYSLIFSSYVASNLFFKGHVWPKKTKKIRNMCFIHGLRAL